MSAQGEAALLYTELLLKLSQFQIHAMPEVDAVTCVCNWCGKDIFGEFDARGLNELARDALLHKCADG